MEASHLNDNIKKLIQEATLTFYLLDRRYTLEDIGINAKLVFDWSKQGLLLEKEKPKGRRKYSVVEFVWLRLVIGLREFGLSLDAIRKLRNFLLESYQFSEIIDKVEVDLASDTESAHTALEKIKTQHTLLQSIAQEEGQDLSEILNEVDKPEMEFARTVIASLVLSMVIDRTDTHLLITSKGECALTFSAQGEIFTASEDFSDQAFITYPLRTLLTEFIQKEDVVSKDELVEQNILTAKEAQVLELLRKDNLVSLSVRMGKNNEIKLIETEENLKVENVKGKLTDYIMRNQYQQITYKTQKGKITSVRRITKHK